MLLVIMSPVVKSRYTMAGMTDIGVHVLDYHFWKQKTKKKMNLMYKSSGQKQYYILTFRN